MIAGHTHTLSMEHAVAKSGRHHGFRDSEDAEDLLLAEEKAEAKKVT